MKTPLANLYQMHQAKIASLNYEEAVRYIVNVFTDIWIDEYVNQCQRITNLTEIQLESFNYIYDDVDTLQQLGNTELDIECDSRLLVVFGQSIPLKRKREDSRLKGWIGPTHKFLGKEWNKGHFIAHRIGGSVDGSEINVFQQKKTLNQALSDEGKLYTKMESYCAKHLGTFCFSRPVYTDKSAIPSFLEYGVLMENKVLWVEYFNNQV